MTVDNRDMQESERYLLARVDALLLRNAVLENENRELREKHDAAELLLREMTAAIMARERSA
jgi:hypothetical protein